MEKTTNSTVKAARIVMKFPGIGTYVGEAGWTVLQMLRKAGNDLGIDPKAWRVKEIKEGKSTTVYTMEQVAATETAPAEAERCTATCTALMMPPEPCYIPNPQHDVEARAFVEHLLSWHPVFGYYVPDSRLDAEGYALVERLLDWEPIPEVIVKKVRFQRSHIQEALKYAVDFAASGKSAMPILTHVAMVMDGKDAVLTATDLEVRWTRHVACEGDAVAACIPAKLLLSEVKALPAGVQVVELGFIEEEAGSMVSVKGIWSRSTGSSPPLRRYCRRPPRTKRGSFSIRCAPTSKTGYSLPRMDFVCIPRA